MSKSLGLWFARSGTGCIGIALSEFVVYYLTIEAGWNMSGVERKRSAAEVHALYSIRHRLQALAGRVMSDVTRKANQAYMEKTL